MCNVRKDDIIIDPFAGTGSLLVSSSHLGYFLVFLLLELCASGLKSM